MTDELFSTIFYYYMKTHLYYTALVIDHILNTLDNNIKYDMDLKGGCELKTKIHIM